MYTLLKHQNDKDIDIKIKHFSLFRINKKFFPNFNIEDMSINKVFIWLF